MGLGQKIKDAVTPGHKKEHYTTDPAYAGTGMGGYEVRHEETTKVEAPLATETPLDTGRGSGERPLEGGAMMGEREGQAGSHEMRAGTDDLRGEEQSCGAQTFVQVEDRPLVKERVERVVEHHPVEKQYVQETRFVGERPIPSQTGATSLGVQERVVETTEPGPTCPTPGAPVVTTTGEHLGQVHQDRTMDI